MTRFTFYFLLDLIAAAIRCRMESTPSGVFNGLFICVASGAPLDPLEEDDDECPFLTPPLSPPLNVISRVLVAAAAGVGENLLMSARGLGDDDDRFSFEGEAASFVTVFGRRSGRELRETECEEDLSTSGIPNSLMVEQRGGFPGDFLPISDTGIVSDGSSAI